MALPPTLPVITKARINKASVQWKRRVGKSQTRMAFMVKLSWAFRNLQKIQKHAKL
jgi:hypothetical protein